MTPDTTCKPAACPYDSGACSALLLIQHLLFIASESARNALWCRAGAPPMLVALD